MFATQEKKRIHITTVSLTTHTHTHTHITETPGIAYIFQRKAKLFYMHFVLFNNDLQDLLFGSKYLRATVTENNSRRI